jgi:nitrogen regulatory protein P-II 1
MKEIKAYIRCSKAEEVIQALEEIGITGVTLIDVMGMGNRLADDHESKYSISCVEKYSKVAKLEIVCADDKLHQIVEIIREKAYTGLKGDGIIFVSSVEMAVNIRTGAIGEEGL